MVPMRMSPDQAAWVEAAFDHPAFLAVVGPSLVVRSASGEPAAWDDSLVVPGPEDIDERARSGSFEEPKPAPRPVKTALSFEAELQNLREELGASSKWRFLWQTDA